MIMTDSKLNNDRTFVDRPDQNGPDQTIVDFIDDTNAPSGYDSESQPIGYLIIKNGNYRGRVFQLVEKTTVGRKEGNIIVRDPQMSRRHARITQENDKFFIEDLNTINGTLVNGTVVTGKQLLKQDDILLVGETQFEFKFLG